MNLLIRAPSEDLIDLYNSRHLLVITIPKGTSIITHIAMMQLADAMGADMFLEELSRGDFDLPRICKKIDDPKKRKSIEKLSQMDPEIYRTRHILIPDKSQITARLVSDIVDRLTKSMMCRTDVKDLYIQLIQKILWDYYNDELQNLRDMMRR